MKQRVGVLALLFAILSLPAPSRADWPADGLAVSTAAGDQTAPVAVSDGAGGAIVAWPDYRAGNYDIYARRVASYGAAVWTADGVPVCTAPFDQTAPMIASDGDGGAIIVWVDFRNGTDRDIYAQRIDQFGTVRWAADGVAVCSVTNNQYAPAIAPDGAGGAIVVWYDYRSLRYDIYAQHIDANGALQWMNGGAPVCTKFSNQNSPVIVADGAGGAVIAWLDLRNSNADVFAQRLDGSGAPQWTTDGVAVCTDLASQTGAVIASDGSSGAVIAWRDQRSGNADIYGQRMDATGVARWTANGAVICNAAYDQTHPSIGTDGAGGVVLAWQDGRSSTSFDIYAQRMNAAGAAQWTTNGVALCAAAADQVEPSLAADSAGGAFVAWQDVRNANADIYAQHVAANGMVQWATDGVAMCTATADQTLPAAVSDGSTGITATWQDARNANADIYAMRLDASGGVPTAVAVHAAPPAFTMKAAYPNPFSSTTWVDGVLPSASDVTVELFDVAGRRLHAARLGVLRAGDYSIAVVARDDSGRPLPSGVYFCRVTAGRSSRTQKLVVAR